MSSSPEGGSLPAEEQRHKNPRGEHQEQQRRVDTSFLPCLIQQVFHHVVGQYLYQSDDFVTLIRKVCAIAYLIGGIMCLAGVPFYLFLSTRDMKSDATLAAGKNPTLFGGTFHVPDLIIACSFLVFSLTVLAAYGFLRVQKAVSDKVIVACVLGAGQLVTCLTFFSSDFDVVFFCTVLLAFVILNDCPCKPLFNAWWILLQFIAYFNHAFDDSVGRGNQTSSSTNFVFRHPDVRHREGVMRFLITASGWPGMICIFFCLQGVLNENKKQFTVAKRSTLLAQKVVAELRSYNTDRVQKLVDEAREDEGNPELINSFEALVENLKNYRPFLPNYLFLQHDDDWDIEGGSNAESSVFSYTDVEGIAEHQSHNPTNPSPQSRALSSNTMELSGGNENPLGEQQHRSPRTLARSFHRHSMSPMSASLRSARSGGEHSFYSMRISFALVDIDVNRLMRNGSSLLPSSETKDEVSANSNSNSSKPSITGLQNSALAAVANLVYQLAKETKASVHSMLGDQVQLTWGATGAVPQSEAKGALFLIRLRLLAALRLQAIHQKRQHISDAEEAQQQQPGAPAVLPGLSGAICSGEAMVHSIISVNTMQQALVVHAPWLPALEGCFDLGKRHGAMLADEATAMSASLSVASVAVESLSYIESHSSTPIACSVEQITARPLSQPTFTFHEPRTSQSQVTCGLTAPSGSAKSCLVFQLTEEKKREADVEWMYQLDRAETTDDCKKSPEEVQKLVIQSFSQGKTEEARSLLEPETEGPFPTTDGDESSTSVETAAASSTRAMSPAPSGCLPSLHQVIVASLHYSEEQHSSPVVKF